jgi:lipopolysaccharide transport system permease protein
MTMTNPIENEKWDQIIRPKTDWLDIHFRELWNYRDLVLFFVKRDFSAFYKQTVLGPLWYVIQPLLTTIVFTVVFGKVAKIPTDGIPPFLFYLSGIVAWNYFADCLKNTSSTFITNANIFGKVYFPRLTVPLSVALINMIQFSIQFILFLCFYFFFMVKGAPIYPNKWLMIIPLLIMQMAFLGLGIGILVSSLTTKYRDLNFAVGFVISLWMYASPIVYPVSSVPDKYLFLYMLNPMAPIIDMFRFAFLGNGIVHPGHWMISIMMTVIIFFVGLLLFNRVEKTFSDTI